jgi:hypothetical protein
MRSGFDYWVVKTDGSGSIQWLQSIGGPGDDWPHAIKQTSDGGFIVVGESTSSDLDITNHHGSASYSDGWVVRLNSAGVIQWQKSLGGTQYDAINDLVLTDDGGYLLAGYSSSIDNDLTVNNGYKDFWIVKLSPDNLKTGAFSTPSSDVILSPNPAKNEVNIRYKSNISLIDIEIYDIAGRMVLKTNSAPLDNSFSVNITSLEKGIYNVVMKDAEKTVFVKKMVKE